LIVLHVHGLIRISSDIYHSLEYRLDCNFAYLHRYMGQYVSTSGCGGGGGCCSPLPSAIQGLNREQDENYVLK